MRIWSTENPESLTDENERKIHRLLLKYSGSYKSHKKWLESREARRFLAGNGDDDLAGKHIRHDANGRVVSQDIDERCRIVLAEIERVMNNSNRYTQSAVLHCSDQKFPTHVLRVELERELDCLLREQIMERERMVNLLEQPGNVRQSKDEGQLGVLGEEEEEEEETDGEWSWWRGRE